jgi:hypothetical protein
MKVIYRSFILSFSVLWRYLIVLPFLAIPCGLIAIVASFFPLIGIVIATGALTFVMMIGFRSAFQAIRAGNDLDFGQLVKASLIFGIAQILLGLLVGLVVIAAFAVMALIDPEVAPLLRNPRANIAAITGFFQTSEMTQIISMGSFVLLQAISAVIAVPMAGAAHSATPNDPGTDIWRGLGSSFWAILAILLVCYGVGTLSGLYDGLGLAGLFTVSAAIAAVAGEPIIWVTPQHGLWLLGCIVFLIWTSCWYFAAAALGWNKHLHDRQQAIAAIHRPQHVDADGLRALREARSKP